MDWARTVLTGGEQEGGLAAALDGLNHAVRSVREDENRRFAERLAAWHASPAGQPGVIPIERVLDEAVAAAVDARPVLLLVLDGMGFPSFRQLYASLGAGGDGGSGWLPVEMRAWWPLPRLPASRVCRAPASSRGACGRGRGGRAP